jgi:GrpB-like predicted nucleotidyltransferase (UPF0157 family)
MKELKEGNVTFESDPYWPHRYESERERIRDVSSDGLLGVFHVGSTALTDVPGKPALDIIAVYDDDEALSTTIERLTNDDRYEREGDSLLVIRWEDDYAVFLKTHTRDDQKVRNQLLFRDYLREHPNMRSEYGHVKREAAEAHSEDVEAYTKAKTEFVSSVLERAREDGYDERLPDFA